MRRSGAGDLWQADSLNVGQGRPGIVEVDVAEDVEGLGAELEAHLLVKGELLEGGKVGVDIGGPQELVPLLVAVGVGISDLRILWPRGVKDTTLSTAAEQTF